MSQADKEDLTFKIGISGTAWERLPIYSISVDGEEVVSKRETLRDGDVDYVEFTKSFEEDKEHVLQIHFHNKTDADTVKSNYDSTEYTIVKDMLLNIESIEIDDIDIGQLKWSASSFVPLDNTKDVLKNCVNLGWNGHYELKFSSPFYIWLLENM